MMQDEMHTIRKSVSWNYAKNINRLVYITNGTKLSIYINFGVILKKLIYTEFKQQENYLNM